MRRECSSISARFLCLSWIRSDSIESHPHASTGSPKVQVYTSPLLLTQCSEIVHQAHCLIVYPLPLSEAETLNRGNSFSSGFMPHSEDAIPAICFNFTPGWNLKVQHSFSLLHFFFSLGPVTLGRIIFAAELASGNSSVCWILEVCWSVTLMLLTSYVYVWAA